LGFWKHLVKDIELQKVGIIVSTGGTDQYQTCWYH
jgi:hypothetical protein